MLRRWIQNTSRGDRFKCGVLVALLAVVLYYGLVVMDLPQARWIQAYCGYYLCLVASLGAVWTISRNRHELSAALLPPTKRARWLAMAAALAASYLSLLHEPFAMRVFNDEPNHAVVAQSMGESRGVYSANSGYYEVGAYVRGGVDPFYRMYLYPFALSVLHNLTGMRIENAYILNAGVTFFTFLLVFLLGRKLVGGQDEPGYAAQALLLASPLFVQTSNSAAYDPLNLMVLAAYALSCLYYAERPGIKDGMPVCLALGLLLAYGRSESVLFLAVFAVLFAVKCLRQGRVELSRAAVFSPVLLIGPLAARHLAQNFGQTFDRIYGAEADGMFKLDYFPKNSVDSIRWFFSGADADLNSWWLATLFLIVPLSALALLLFYRLTRRQIDPAKAKHGEAGRHSSWVVLLFLAAIAFQVSLFMSQFWSPVEASALRFFLPTTLFMVIAVVWGMSVITDRLGRTGTAWAFRILALGTLLFFWGIGLPKAARAETTYASLPGTYGRQALDWAQANDTGRTLYAVRSVDYFSLHRLPVVQLDYFYNYYAAVDALVAEGLYDQVLVIDYRFLDPTELQWVGSQPRFTVLDELVLETIDQKRGFLHAELSVQRVVGWRASGEETTPLGELDQSNIDSSSNAAYFEQLQSLRGNHPGNPEKQ